MAGHEIVGSIEFADIVLFDLHSRISNYNQEDIDYVIENKIPVAVFDEWDRGGQSKDIWPHPLIEQQQQLLRAIYVRDIPSVHFIRLLDKTQMHPSNHFPFEKPISYIEPMADADELFSRKYDVCFIANKGHNREKIADALRGDTRLHCDIAINEPKIPVHQFVERHRNAKLFVSSSAGGMGDERVQMLFSVAGIIREETNWLLLNDFTNMDNCVRFDAENPAKSLDLIYETVRSKDLLFRIYSNGYDYVKKYYSEEFIATNILEKCLTLIKS